MKTSLFSLICVLILVSCTKEEDSIEQIVEEIEEQDEKQKNPCRITSRIVYSVLDSDIKTEWTYNSDDFLIEKKIFRNDTLFLAEENIRHDSLGNILYYANYGYPGKVVGSRITQEFNQKCQLIKRIEDRHWDNSGFIEEWTYNENGLEDGYKQWYRGYISNYNSNYQYDSSGNLIYREEFSMDELIRIYTAEYNVFNNMNWYTYEFLRGAMNFYLGEFKYDNSHNLTAFQYFKDGNLQSHNKNYSYDKNGNAVYYEHYGYYGNLSSTTTSTFICDD